MRKVMQMIELAHRRAIRCALAWTFALAALLVVFYGAVRYEPFLTANVEWPILLKLNHYVSPVPFVNDSIWRVSELPILTGALFLSLFWYLWFEAGSDEVRARLLLGLSAAVTAVILSRGLQVMLPVHARPLHNPMSGFDIPPGVNPALLKGWSSFPSDHACVYFALTTVIWRQSRVLGLFALLSTLLGSLPRIYFGFHYPTDVALGALLGIVWVVLIEDYGPEKLARRVVLVEHHKLGLFYFFGFLFSYEVATLFKDIRQIGKGLGDAYHLAGFLLRSWSSH
jgi:undecaprenyl-diphosphatase